MRIQFILRNNELYGANRVLLSIADYLKANNHEISILLPSKGGITQEFEDRNIPYYTIFFFPPFLYFRLSPKYLAWPILFCINIIKFFPIVNVVRKFNPDIIYSNTSAENIGILISKILKKKHISHIHEFMSLDYATFFIAGKKNKQAYINQSDGVIFVSKAVANYIMGSNTLKSKHRIIPNGVPNPEIILHKKTLSEELNFGIVGILSPGKGQDLAIEYFAKLLFRYPKSKLHIYGDKEGWYKKKIVRLINKLNLQEKVILHGFQRNTNAIFETLDILFMFSKSEGFGMVTVEAMLRGVPVIGFNNAGTGEIITDKQTGCLFNDYNSFQDSVSYLICSNDTYENIRSQAHITAKSQFCELTFTQNIEKFIKQIANSN